MDLDFWDCSERMDLDFWDVLEWKTYFRFNATDIYNKKIIQFMM